MTCRSLDCRCANCRRFAYVHSRAMKTFRVQYIAPGPNRNSVRIVKATTPKAAANKAFPPEKGRYFEESYPSIHDDLTIPVDAVLRVYFGKKLVARMYREEPNDCL